MSVKARAVSKPDYLVPIEPQNYKFIEEQARKRGNISIEECFNQIMEEIMMRKMLEDENQHFKERMRKFDEEIRRWN
jgi:hypothetical protein